MSYPGIVGFVVRRRCPKMLLGAAITCLPYWPWIGAGPVMFIPALLLGASAGPDCERGHRFATHIVGSVGVVLFGLAALWLGFPRYDPATPIPFAWLKTAVVVAAGVAFAAGMARSLQTSRHLSPPRAAHA